jgi:hypothetical protein
MGSKGQNNAPSDKQMTKMGGPWQPLQEPLKDLIGDAQDLYNKGNWQYGPNIVQRWRPEQKLAFDQAMGIANQGGQALQQAYGFGGQLAGGGMVGNAPGQNVLNNIANQGFQNGARDEYGQLLQTAMGGSGGMDYLRNVAGGGFLGGNPHLEGMIDAASQGVTRRYNEATMPGIETRMAQAGALGSNAEQTLASQANTDLAQQLGNIETGIRGQDYAQERGYQQQAGMALPGAFGQEIGTGLAAAGGVSGDAWNDLQARLTAAQGAGQGYRADIGQAMGAGGMLGGLYGQQYAPQQQMMNWGGQVQQQQERQAAEEQDKFRYKQAAPWDNLNRILQSFQGVGGQTNPQAAAQYAMQQQQPQADPWMQLAGMGSNLAGMWLLSDEKLKQDVSPAKGKIGGVARKRFRYLWEPEGVEHVGVMAQDAIRAGRDDAVAVHPSGFFMVDYDRLGRK